jgi:hypothetical protein
MIMTMTMTVIWSSVLLVCTNYYYYVKSNHVKYQVKKEKNTFYFASQLNTDFVFKVTLRRHHQKTAAAAAAKEKKE